MSLFNICIITTSTEQRARVYRQLVQRRKDHGIYPAEIDFRVYADPQGVYAGSGGATLLALDQFSKECVKKNELEFSFQSNKILIIHAGGKGNALWPYLSEGVLFTPVPIDSSSTISPIMLDLQLNFFLKYHWMQSEIVVSPGDIFIDCDPSLLAESRGDLHGFAVPATFEKGVSHGVFKFDSYMHSVVGYYQKAGITCLSEQATIEGTDLCAIDTGIVSFSPSFAEAFLSFGNMIVGNQSIREGITNGSISFNIYLEVLTAALNGMTYESYKEKISSRSGVQTDYLALAFKAFSGFNLTATLIKNAQFHHLNTVKKYLELCTDLQENPIDVWYSHCYAELKVKRNASWIVYNTHKTKVPLRKGNPILIESVTNSTFENPLGNNIFAGISNWETDCTIPEGICIDRRVINKNELYCVYSLTDTFNAAESIDNVIFCGIPLKKWLSQRSLDSTDIGFSEQHNCLGDAQLYCSNVSDTFISGYWQKPIGTQWADTFRKGKRFSFNECSMVEYALARDQEREEIRSAQLCAQISAGTGWISVSSKDFSRAFSNTVASEKLGVLCEATGDVMVKAYRKRLLDLVRGVESSTTTVGFLQHESSEEVFDSGFSINSEQCVVVRCPVRVDIAGGWTDTPPFTLRHGGAVVNFAVNLYGNEPIQVFCKRSDSLVIKLSSIDRGVSFTVDNFSALTTFAKEFDIAVAVLNVLGFSKGKYSSLKDLLRSIGGGIELTTFCGVPNGAGLGASSILTAALITSLFRLFGKGYDSQKLLDTIIKVEQQLGMGSGWQDPLGGITGGIKLIQSKSGLIPEPKVQTLNADMFSNPDIFRRFMLVNTGIKRTSNNPGREVVGLMNENVPSYHFTLDYLKKCACSAAEAIATKNLEMLSHVINECRIANDRIYSSSSNPQLKSLLSDLRPYYSAVKMTGAGGGGFALFLSESPECAASLRKAIETMSTNFPVVVDFSLNTIGMSVKVL